MIDGALIATGIGIGLAMTVPVGPVNVLCINRALHIGPVAGFMAGVGAVIADAFFASAAAFGVQWLAGLVRDNQALLEFACGALLLAYGIHLLRSAAAQDPGDGPGRGVMGGVLAGFLFTITNPAGLFGFFAIFSGLQGVLVLGQDYMRACVLIASVMAGGLAWYLALSTLVAALRERFSGDLMSRVNRVSGVVLMGFGLALMAHYIVQRIVPGA